MSDMKHLIIAVLIASLVAFSFAVSYQSKVIYDQQYRLGELELEIEKWKAVVEAQADGSFRLFIEPVPDKES